jgi:hypothetical protein
MAYPHMLSSKIRFARHVVDRRQDKGPDVQALEGVLRVLVREYVGTQSAQALDDFEFCSTVRLVVRLHLVDDRLHVGVLDVRILVDRQTVDAAAGLVKVGDGLLRHAQGLVAEVPAKEARQDLDVLLLFEVPQVDLDQGRREGLVEDSAAGEPPTHELVVVR